MALSNSIKKKYIQTFESWFVLRTTKDHPDAIPRENRNGDTVHELRYDTLEGFITSFEIVKKEFESKGKKIKSERLEISMIDGDDNYTLTLSSVSSHAFNFYNAMEKINYNEKVIFQLWAYDFPYFAVLQHGDQRVAKSYTKEQIPDWVKKEVNGQDVWDKTDALNFFRPKVKEAMKNLAQSGGGGKKPETVGADVLGDDDLPF